MAETRSVMLVVEPSTEGARQVASWFARESDNIEVVHDGPSAVEVAANHPVDVVLLSFELPEGQGLQTLRLLKASEGRRHLPVLALCEKDERTRRLDALRSGADDVLVAPFDPEDVRARVERARAVRERVDRLLDESAELHRLAITDGLTQVANYRSFQERLKEEFRRAQRYEDPLSLVLIDIDHFKSVNDRFGHPAGDLVLKEVAASIQRSVRDTDFVARYGGEEFAALLPQTHLAGAVTVAERIWRDVGALKLGPSATLKVTASLGVSCFPNRAVVSSEQLLRTADDALYTAKQEGRDRISLHQPPVYADSAKAAG